MVREEIAGRPVALKIEGANPTGSFKDRGSAVLVAMAADRSMEEVVEDSSGNAGAALAAYAARAGLRATVFVPASASGPKLAQIRAFGARVIACPTREDAARQAEAATAAGTPWASHAWSPFQLAGYATLAFELVEGLGRAPGSVVLPAGQGGQLLGLALGFSGLIRARRIAVELALIGVQAAGCAPLAGRPSPPDSADTIAEGIRVRHPVRADQVRTAALGTGGRIETVTDEEIRVAWREAVARGLDIEITSAAAWAYLRRPSVDLPPPVAVVLTATGLKTPR